MVNSQESTYNSEDWRLRFCLINNLAIIPLLTNPNMVKYNSGKENVQGKATPQPSLSLDTLQSLILLDLFIGQVIAISRMKDWADLN